MGSSARKARSASVVAGRLETQEARALLAGMAAHAIAPFTSPLTGALSTLFAVMAHARGWPLVRGGSKRLAEEMADLVTAGGGSVQTGRMVTSAEEAAAAASVVLGERLLDDAEDGRQPEARAVLL